jgi:phage internal scaffolding protein
VESVRVDDDGVLEFVLRAPGQKGYSPDLVSLQTAIDVGSDSLTQQSAVLDSDINEIVRRFGLTGELPSNVRMPVSGDFAGIADFQTVMNLVRQAEEGFMSFPAEVRERFSHDPGRMIAFLEDDSNRAEAEKLGLVVPKKQETPPA